MTNRFTIKDLEQKKSAGLIRDFSVKGEQSKPKRSKYGNKKVEIDGQVFDSIKESKRYIQLRYLLRAGEIKYLERQVEFELHVNGEKVASYFADFVFEKDGKMIVEDVKSPTTRRIREYRLKKKLMVACHGIEIQEF